MLSQLPEIILITDHALQHKTYPYIEVMEDHSLKYQGAELRFKRPLSGEDIIMALREMGSALKDSSYDVYTKGDRGSVHIHVDVSDLTWGELILFIGASYIAEPFLFSLCPPQRASTCFCVPMNKTRDFRGVYDRLFKPGDYFGNDYYKYRGIGLNSIYSRGSLEFRMFDTCTNMHKILDWINILLRLRRVAVDTLNFEFFKEATKLDLDGFLTTVTGRPAPSSPKIRKQTWDTLRQLSYIFKTWDPVMIREEPSSKNVGPVPDLADAIDGIHFFDNTNATTFAISPDESF